MQTLIAQSITCHEHGISSGLFKVSCLQNLPQPAVPPQTQQTGGSMVRLEDPGGYKSCIQYHRTKSPFRSYITIPDILLCHPNFSFSLGIPAVRTCATSHHQYASWCDANVPEAPSAKSSLATYATLFDMISTKRFTALPIKLLPIASLIVFHIGRFRPSSASSSGSALHHQIEHAICLRRLCNIDVFCRWNSIRCEVRCAINIAHHYGSVGVNLYCTKQY